MTKVNENGQVEFTFEELDFDGAYEIISNEMDLIKREISVLKNALPSINLVVDYLRVTDRMSLLSEKHSNLYDVCKLILNLKHWKG